MAKERISTREKLIYALGDIFGGGGQSLIAVIYLIFLTNVVKLNPAWAGTVLMISKLWDAVSDPLMGLISDNTHSKMGRRKPYIAFGSLGLILAMALMWLPVNFPSEIGKVIYMTVVYVFYSTISTIIAVPYSSLSTEITTDIDERSRINMLRLVFSTLSTAICTLVPSALFSSLTNGDISVWQFYFAVVLGFGIPFALPLLLIGIFTKERVVYENSKTSFNATVFIRPLKIRAFRNLLVLYLAQSCTLDLVSAVIMYYSLYVVAGLDSTVFLGIFLGVQILMFPVINLFLTKVSKTRIYYLGLPLTIASSVILAFYPAGKSIIPLYAVTALMALGFAGAQSMSWIIFPDVVDIGTLEFREQLSGSFSGLMTFIRKTASAIAIFILGYVLQLTGFITPTEQVKIPQQPDSAILGIRLVIFLSFLLLMGYAYFKARSFRLTPEVSSKVKELNLKLAGKVELTKEEEEELENIRKEFIR